jgi:SMODS-associated and fused to various effectors sensor domain
VPPNNDFSLNLTDEQTYAIEQRAAANGNAVAMSISAEASIDEDVKQYLLQQGEPVATLRLLQTKPMKLRDAGDAVALAEKVRQQAIDLVRQLKVQRLLLFYRGPAPGGCFIDQRLNQVCDEIVIMTHQNQGPVYVPSFSFKR